MSAKDITQDPNSLSGILEEHDKLYEETMNLKKSSKEYKEAQKTLQKLRIKYNETIGWKAFKTDI